MKGNKKKKVTMCLALVLCSVILMYYVNGETEYFKDSKVQAEETVAPSEEPTTEPTTVPSESPVASPVASAEPTVVPSAPVSAEPTVVPSAPVSAEPSVEPSAPVSAEPSVEPSAPVSAEPSVEPSAPVSAEPSVAPTTPVVSTPTPVQPSEEPQVNDEVKFGYNTYKITENSSDSSDSTDSSTNETPKVVLAESTQEEYGKTFVTPAKIYVDGKTYEVTKIADGVYKNNDTIEKVIISGNTQTVGKQAFQNCENLENVYVGKNVTTIESEAFANCEKLSSVTIASGVTTIGDKCFNQCENLKTIVIYSLNLKDVPETFLCTTENVTVYVPADKYKEYKALLKNCLPKSAKILKISQ